MKFCSFTWTAPKVHNILYSRTLLSNYQIEQHIVSDMNIYAEKKIIQSVASENKWNNAFFRLAVGICFFLNIRVNSSATSPKGER